MVQSSSVEFPPSFHVLILRLRNSLACAYTECTIGPTMVGDRGSKRLEVCFSDNPTDKRRGFSKVPLRTAFHD